jgi:hypothetical protein
MSIELGIKMLTFSFQNRYMITFGLLAISCCLAFIYNMKLEAEKKLTYGETYMAMDDEDQLVSRQKRSKWD